MKNWTVDKSCWKWIASCCMVLFTNESVKRATGTKKVYEGSPSNHSSLGQSS